MAYLTFLDFRTATLADVCYGLDLTSTEAPDAALTTAIASYSQRIDNLTNDHFESESRTFELNVADYSDRLYLPRRARAVSSVNTRLYDGTLTAEVSTNYRLFSSLDPTGTFRVEKDGLDRLEVVPPNSLSTGSTYWPIGPQSVQVIGTWSWATVPGDIKWAVARLCYARFKESRPDLDRAETLSNSGVTLRFLESDEDHPTGIREVDEVVADYRRDPALLVG